MEDIAGNPVKVGDFLCDSRGRCYQVLPTDGSLLASKIALTRTVGSAREEQVFVRLYGALKVDSYAAPEELRLHYLNVVRATSKPRIEALRERRRMVDKKLRETGRRKYD